MSIDIKENTLYLVDINVDMDDLLKRNQTIQIENIIVLKNHLVFPFDDLMRSIIIAIYRYNIKEIVVVSNFSNENRQKGILQNSPRVFQEGSQEKKQTLQFLFENCKPEFQGDSLNEWIGNGEPRNTVHFLSQHPLLPPDIRITELTYLKEGNCLS